MAMTPEEKEAERRRMASNVEAARVRSSTPEQLEEMRRRDTQTRKAEKALSALSRPPPPGDPRLAALTARSSYDQNKAYEDGAARFDPLFGMNNPAMKEIMDARRSAAFGQDGYADTLRAQGVQGINSTMSTGLRSLRGMQAGSGVRGGAALGQALPMLTQANQARSGLESNIALADMQRRSAALGDLESTVTGERAGSLGTNFGWTGLDSANRNNALQYLTSMDFMKNAQAGANPASGDTRATTAVIDQMKKPITTSKNINTYAAQKEKELREMFGA